MTTDGTAQTGARSSVPQPADSAAPTRRWRIERTDGSPPAEYAKLAWDLFLFLGSVTLLIIFVVRPAIQWWRADPASPADLDIPAASEFTPTAADIDDAVRILTRDDAGTPVTVVGRFDPARPARWAVAPGTAPETVATVTAVIETLAATSGVTFTQIDWPADGPIPYGTGPLVDDTLDLAIYPDGNLLAATGTVTNHYDGTIAYAEAHIDPRRPRTIWEEIWQVAGPIGDGDRADSIFSTDTTSTLAPSAFDQWLVSTFYQLETIPQDPGQLAAALAAAS